VVEEVVEAVVPVFASQTGSRLRISQVVEVAVVVDAVLLLPQGVLAARLTTTA
jgi:hypothetical protein